MSTTTEAAETVVRELPAESGWWTGRSGVRLRGGADGPVEFGGIETTGASLVSWRPLVEVFTADEQRARTSRSYVRSAVGDRLRLTQLSEEDHADAVTLEIVQTDHVTGLQIRSTLTRPSGLRVLRIEQEVTNPGSDHVVITALVTAVVGLGPSEEALDEMSLAWAESAWLAESRWHEQPLHEVVPPLSLGIHEQDGRGRFALTSTGAWPTGEFLPLGVLVDPSTGTGLGWQIESGTGWQWSIGSTLEGGFLSLTGPADLEHHFARRLAPGASFTAVPVAIALVEGGRDDVFAALTSYRRWLLARTGGLRGLPVIYNDFMNTLMGDPTSSKLRPLIAGAAAAGADVFCIDAGWFASRDEGDWWNTVGEWRENPERFEGSFRSILDEIRAAGMIAGTWLEPEVMGVTSPLADRLPEDAFFHRFGTRVVEHERYSLDFRHPAVRAHLDETVDRLVHEYGIGYLKLDFNIDPGAGTEHDATAAGDGLLAHSRAYRTWLSAVRDRHAHLVIENCASGGMRMDYSYVALSDLQSTSDQQDHLASPVISASSPATLLPEQSGNWAYPSPAMTEEETAFSLVNGLPGRLILSGFLDRLRPEQSALVAEAVDLAHETAPLLARATPFWPNGLPAWNDAVIVVGFRDGSESLVFVWDRGAEATSIRLAVSGDPEVVFPLGLAPWSIRSDDGVLQLDTLAGPTARVLRLSEGPLR